ncbi:uncharacterized protein [Blastocystis hominis]|uniref:Uncharacterized protein n=1 Tax=Blastocystis hominis TaxID=12968 RepID=D8M9A2_BLAHO|nr:uncharacterized protein [Blastocystis hominis]CBK24641.2 unnamed protein product [Blastocystis hominis]|eukprot:XP_012898689.1 uncharacterized protein [Blastocystis hominis]
MRKGLELAGKLRDEHPSEDAEELCLILQKANEAASYTSNCCVCYKEKKDHCVPNAVAVASSHSRT